MSDKNSLPVVRLLLGLMLLTAALGAAAQKARPTAEGPVFKNLGGPAEEIASMRLPDPAALGTRSKSVMIPLRSADALREISIPVDAAENFRLMLIAPAGRNIVLQAAAGKEDFYDLRREGFARRVAHTETSYGVGEARYPAEVFDFEALEKGVLRVRFELPEGVATGGETLGYLVASSETPYRLYSYLDTFQTVAGREIGLVAALFDRRENDETGRPASLFGALREAAAFVLTPDGELVETALAADGNGRLRAGFVPAKPGRYTAQIVARGTTPEGDEFIRSAEHTFEVAPRAAALRSGVKTTLVDALRWRIDLPVDGLPAGEKVILHGEIWGRDESGNEFPVAWAGGMTVARAAGKRETSLALTLDARWLAGSAAAKSYELRRVRVQHPDAQILLGGAESLALPGVFVPAEAKQYAGLVTDEMRQGVRPLKASNEAVGGKLMLVHGYCSGDAWGAAAAAGQFTNYVKFLDLNRNRSHDQFANLIRNFGASLPSFGIVAHSQGGAASLHLYTYYWSGLDYATGPRLIQSVGTPYQGTALAGNLALLGQIFGAGCGSNYDLTYGGAAAWLANIPSWARAKVFYHTTSFTDVWWRYDYCNLATDPFLSDPDDGVVERAYAQLSGAFNLGHKTGWCHTGGMRDPSQTNDSSRNSNMNTNAAR